MNGVKTQVTEHKHYLHVASYSCPAGQTLQGTGIGSVCRAIIGATPVYACPAGYSAQSAGCVSTATNGASLQASTVRYFHTDHLGSVTAITDETGLVVERLAYDAWGKRRFSNGTADVNDTVVGLTTDRGYTEHEELDELGIIHMNGRIYDPYIGRFMSADPFIQAPYELQSHNRYAYVMNNPLLYTDPSGFSWWTKFRSIVIYVIAAVVDGYGYGSVCGGSCVQAVQYYNAAKSAYNFAQTVQSQGWGTAIKGALKQYVISQVSQGMFEGAGIVGEGIEYSWQHYAAHAFAGCISSVAGGGKCGQGAASAVAGLFATELISNGKFEYNEQNKALAHAAVQVAGGLASEAVGGSFANGAQTASYGYLYNACGSRHGCALVGGMGATAIGVAVADGCTVATAGACVLPSPLIVGEAALLGTAAGSAIDSAVDALESVHGNSANSQRSNTVYEIIQISTGEVMKYGVTCQTNAECRYDSSFYTQRGGLRMFEIATFQNRWQALALEKILCGKYAIVNGHLPPMSSRC